MSTSKINSNPLARSRQLYTQAQNDVNNGRLNKITEERMNKRYIYTDRELGKMQDRNDPQSEVKEMKFYRDKFKKVTELIQESVRESYQKNKFETQAKDVFRDSYGEQAHNRNKNRQSQNNIQPTESKIIPSFKKKESDERQKEPRHDRREEKKSLQSNARANRDENNRSKSPQNRRTSKSPLNELFQSRPMNKSKRGFDAIVPKRETEGNKHLLEGLKSMKKRSVSNLSRHSKSTHQHKGEDSKLRELRRENAELQKIANRRNIDTDSRYGNGRSDPRTKQELEKEIYYFKKVNQQLRDQVGRLPPNSQSNGYYPSTSTNSIYEIPFRKNNINDISYRNMEHESARFNRDSGIIGDSDSSGENSRSRSRRRRNFGAKSQSQISESYRFNRQKVQREREVYINKTPQILFQNELMKVLVIRHPFRIQEKIYEEDLKSNFDDSKLDEVATNEQKLQVLVINSSHGHVKNQEFRVKTTYRSSNNGSKSCHSAQATPTSFKRYKKNIIEFEKIVYSEMVRVKLVDKDGYNEEFRVGIRCNYFYTSDEALKKRTTRMGEIIKKEEGGFEVEVKLPVTFIEFSSKPFNGLDVRDVVDNQKDKNRHNKMPIRPNRLYDTYEHTYMNTKLPLKQMPSYKANKERALLYGHSYVHKNLSNNGDRISPSNDRYRAVPGKYLEGEVEMVWSEKDKGHENCRYLTISTLSEWVYLLGYMFMGIDDEQQEFNREFGSHLKEGGMHVSFNSRREQNSSRYDRSFRKQSQRQRESSDSEDY